MGCRELYPLHAYDGAETEGHARECRDEEGPMSYNRITVVVSLQTPAKL